MNEKMTLNFEGDDLPAPSIAELEVLETMTDIDADKRISDLRQQVLKGFADDDLVYHHPARPESRSGEFFRLTQKGFARLRVLQQKYRQITTTLHFDPIQIRVIRQLRPSESISLGRPPNEPNSNYAGGIIWPPDRWRQWKAHLPHVAMSTTTEGTWLLTNTAWRGWVRVHTEGRKVYVSEGVA